MSKACEKRRRARKKAKAAAARTADETRADTPEMTAKAAAPGPLRPKLLSKGVLMIVGVLLVLGPGFALVTMLLSGSSSGMDTKTAIDTMTTQIRRAQDSGNSLPTMADCEVTGAPTTGEFPLYQARCREEVETTVAMAGIQACAAGTRTGAVLAFQKCVRPKFESFYDAQRQGLETARKGSALLTDDPCAQIIFNVGNARQTLLGLQPVRNDVESGHMDLRSFAEDWTSYLKAETRRTATVETDLLSASSDDSAACSA